MTSAARVDATPQGVGRGQSGKADLPPRASDGLVLAPAESGTGRRAKGGRRAEHGRRAERIRAALPAHQVRRLEPRRRGGPVLIIDRVIQWFLPRENRFFVYLDSLAEKVVKAAEVLSGLRKADGPPAFKDVAERLRELEHEADEVAHVLFEEIDKTFVTPLDREDIHDLTSRLDDVVDLIESCAARIAIYGLPSLSPAMKELVRVIEESAREVALCVGRLQDLSKLDEIRVHMIHVNTLENEADRIYRTALAELFANPKDPVQLIREKEILDQLEKTCDTCEDAIDLIRSVVVKNG